MTHYIKDGSTFHMTDEANLDIHKALPAGTYAVMYNPKGQAFYLEQLQDLTIPEKIYGDVQKKAERILTAYQQRNTNTGVLLSGEKGGGKTMLLRLLSKTLRSAGLPTLLIAGPWKGPIFNKFIQSIDQPCMVAVDEFEKLYAGGRDAPSAASHLLAQAVSGDENVGGNQESLLTLLDGTMGGKKLYVFTANEARNISAFMFNRPGRIFYHLKYRGLDELVIEQYAADHLKNKRHLESIKQVVAKVDNFNFDLLQALIEEMNRFGEDAHQASQLLNIRPEASSFVDYETTAYVNGKRQTCWGNGADSNPLNNPNCHVYVKTDDDDPEENDGTKLSTTVYPRVQNMKGREGDVIVFEMTDHAERHVRLEYRRSTAFFDAF